jgi:hypothetical protein
MITGLKKGTQKIMKQKIKDLILEAGLKAYKKCALKSDEFPEIEL